MTKINLYGFGFEVSEPEKAQTLIFGIKGASIITNSAIGCVFLVEDTEYRMQVLDNFIRCSTYKDGEFKLYAELTFKTNEECILYYCLLLDETGYSCIPVPEQFSGHRFIIDINGNFVSASANSRRGEAIFNILRCCGMNNSVINSLDKKNQAQLINPRGLRVSIYDVLEHSKDSQTLSKLLAYLRICHYYIDARTYLGVDLFTVKDEQREDALHAVKGYKFGQTYGASERTLQGLLDIKKEQR